MIFNSYEFLFLFLPVTLLGFYLLYRRGNDVWMNWISLCSIVFYSYWSLANLPVLLISLFLNFQLAKLLAKNKSKALLAFGIALNLLILFYFKYFNFFITTVNETADINFHWHEIILPLGISFFTFQKIAFLADVHKSQKRDLSFPKYVFFITFFPQLIAGPIVHHTEIGWQINKPRKHWNNFTIGFSILVIGLFKKVMIADPLSGIAAPIFTMAEQGGNPTFLEAWYAAIAYSLQIYFDFSAYSDMAMGIGKMFGIRLPQNFASPYKAVSINDFWRRWHITLSRFLRDYLYIPLGGNRKGPYRQKLNLLITMILGGIWHGASWNFLFWGVLHGTYLTINHLYGALTKSYPWLRLPKFMGWIITMVCVVIAWVPFRAPTMEGAVSLWKGMFMSNGIAFPQRLVDIGFPGGKMIEGVDISNGIFMASLIILCLVLPNTAELTRRYHSSLPSAGYPATFAASRYIRWRPSTLWALYIAILFMIAVVNLTKPTEFLYFQF